MRITLEQGVGAAAANRKLIGKPVRYEVQRDGVRITRSGAIKNITARTISIGPYVYLRGEIENLREA